ncbi:unnamed protein product [Sphagnum troendelagicum]
MASTFVSLCQPALVIQIPSEFQQQMHIKIDSPSIVLAADCQSDILFGTYCNLSLSLHHQIQVPPHIDHKPNYNKKNKDKQKMKKHRWSPSPGEASGSKPKKRKHRGHSPE